MKNLKSISRLDEESTSSVHAAVTPLPVSAQHTSTLFNRSSSSGVLVRYPGTLDPGLFDPSNVAWSVPVAPSGTSCWTPCLLKLSDAAFNNN